MTPSDAVPPPRAAGVHIFAGTRHGQDGCCGPSPGRPEGCSRRVGGMAVIAALLRAALTSGFASS